MRVLYRQRIWQACVYLTLTHARACAGTLLAHIRRCLADLHVDLLTVRPSGSQLLCAFDAGRGYDPVLFVAALCSGDVALSLFGSGS